MKWEGGRVGGKEVVISSTVLPHYPRVALSINQFFGVFFSSQSTKHWTDEFGQTTDRRLDSEDSEVLIRPVAMFDDPFRGQPHKIVMCECLTPDLQPIPGNNRAFAMEQFEKAGADEEPWFGIEQEYFVCEMGTENPFHWPAFSVQGAFYCSAGGGNAIARDVAESHYRACLAAGIKVSGINAEVAPSQWEFQIGPCVGIEEGDHMWMARYLLQRVSEMYGVSVTFAPKPVKGDWNGSGAHCNFSTKAMREDGGLAVIEAAIEKLSHAHEEHISQYGTNHERLTGAHETCAIDEFKSGRADRGASIRIGNDTVNNGKGYFEDRRPASDCDPYLVTGLLMKTCVNTE